MFVVYDPLCEGLRDPVGVSARPSFSWRLGSDRAGARQVAWRVVVTSADDGERRWDSGRVASGDVCAVYAGEPLCPGETCVWFVTAEDELGEEAYAVPASFAVGSAGSVPESPLGPQCMAMVWTSDAGLNDELAGHAGEPALWDRVFGLRLADGMQRVQVAPDPAGPQLKDLAFAQLSLVAPRGLLTVRVERGACGASVAVVLPPGMEGKLALGGIEREVGSGRHRLAEER